MCELIVRISSVAVGLVSRPAYPWQDHGVGRLLSDDGPPVGGIWTTCAAMP